MVDKMERAIESSELVDSRDCPGQGVEKDIRTGFSSTLSTYVTLIGYSAGMSDFWRFPFLIYRNGGGAFLIPFVITTLICGVPLFFLEYTLANFSGKGPYKIWDISPLFRGIGVSMLIAFTVYMMGGTVFRGWLLYFFANSFQNPLPWTHCNNEWNTNACLVNPFISIPRQEVTHNVTSLTYNTSSGASLTNQSGMTAAEEYWQYETLRLSSGVTDLSSFNWRIFLCIAAFRLLVFLCMLKSIKSIEKIMFFTTFVQFTFIAIVFIRSLMLQGASDGLLRFFKTDFSKLSNPRIWVEAFLMAFYTMSFGWGSIITVGSHARFRENSVRTCLVIPLVDGGVAMVTGMVCFSVLGNMAHAYGVHVDDVINAGMSLGVVSYITALASLPYPQIWSAGFFIAVILSGIDSQVVPVEMCLQIIGEMFPSLYPKYRFHALVIFSGALVVFALPTATGAGAYIFLWMDWYAGVWSGPVCAFLELIIVAWIYGIDRFSSDVSLMIGRQIPGAIRVIISFVTPCLVLVIFLTSVLEYVPPRYGAYEYPDWARAMGWLLVTCIVSPIPIIAIKTIVNQSGTTCRKQVRNSIKSNSDWLPKDKTAREELLKMRPLLRKRTFTDVFHFALFGRYKDSKELAPTIELLPK